MVMNERSYAGWKRLRGDASRVDSNAKGILGIVVPVTDRDVHFLSAADVATDVNVANPSHPTLYIHSETTPATDYIAITHDGTTGSITVAGGYLTLTGGDLVIADTYGLTVGHTAQIVISDGDGATNLTPEVQVLGTAKADASLVIAGFNTTNTSAVAPMLAFVKSGNGTIASAATAVADNEVVGEIVAFGADGTDLETPVARISFVVDDVGAPGTGAIGGSMEFYTTADGGETLTLSFTVNNDQNLFVANNNGIVVGHTAQITVNALIPEVQVLGTTVGVDGALLVGLYSSTAAEGPEIILARSKSATLGTNTIVASADRLGRIVAMGADGGTGFDPAASINFEVDGTPGATTDMPGRILLMTSPDGSQTPTERVRIASTGLITIATGETPASVGTSPGTNNAGEITATGGLGGNTTIGTTGTAGNGGGYSFTGGAGGVASAATTAATGGIGGVFSVTTGAGGAEAVVGAGNGTGGAGGAFTVLTGDGGAVTTSTGTNLGGRSGAISLTTGAGGAAQDGTDTGGESGDITIATGAGGAGDTGGASGDVILRTGAVGAGGSPVAGIIRFDTAGASEKWRIDTTGNLTSGGAAPSNVTADGAIIATGGIAMTDVLNAWIDDATHGDGTTTHYIGNQTITTSSDMRVKDRIESWVGSAVDFIMGAPRLVEFNYNLPGGGPADEGYGPNARGRYRGWLAQETVAWAPWIVNAGAGINCQDCRAGRDCDLHAGSFWHVEYQHMVPMIVESVRTLATQLSAAVQELTTVKSELAALSR